jgi:hypothetical protein
MQRWPRRTWRTVIARRKELIVKGDNRKHRFALIAIRPWAILLFMTEAIAHLTRTLRLRRIDDEPTLVLRYVQPGLVGLIDGTLSTLAPIFAAALLAGSRSALFVGLATALGAGISMGFSEALSDDGTETGRGSGLGRGLVTGAMTAFGGAFHSLPFLIPNVNTALLVAGIVVALELTTISLIRKRFLAVSLRVSLLQVALGGAMIVGVGVALGSA